jgi:cytochrome c oxidase subunit 1
MSAHADTHAHDDDHGHHPKETFVTKYIFSQDHKMIAKQYLITGTIMGVIGVLMSMMMRMQIAWPEEPNVLFEHAFRFIGHPEV